MKTVSSRICELEEQLTHVRLSIYILSGDGYHSKYNGHLDSRPDVDRVLFSTPLDRQT
jgi:hypothetical protein